MYFTFNLTQQMAQDKVLDASVWFIQHRTYSKFNYIAIVGSAISGAIMLPPLILTITSDTIREETGDGCNRSYADVILVAVVAAYCLVFCVFAWKLRKVIDGFYIKSEVRIS